MKKIILSLLALPLALTLAFGFTSITTPAHAEETAAVDNQFVDGNWFTIAAAKGEAYQVGSPTQVALQAQLDLYQSAVEAGDSEKAEHYAIRSWVKGWYAAEIGRKAYEAGDYAGAAAALKRAVTYGKTAQKPGSGKGETAGRVDDDSAPAYGGTSAVEGQRVVAYAKKWLAKANAKLGASGGDE